MATPISGIQLRRGLLDISSDLKWSAVELARIADRLEHAGNSPDAQAVLRMIQSFQQGEKRLSTMAAEVANGLIVQISENRDLGFTSDVNPI